MFFGQIKESEARENVIASSLLEVLLCAQKSECKSLSIPALKFPQHVIKRIINVVTNILSFSDKKTVGSLELIRFVGTDRSILHLYHEALRTH